MLSAICPPKRLKRFWSIGQPDVFASCSSNRNEAGQPTHRGESRGAGPGAARARDAPLNEAGYDKLNDAKPGCWRARGIRRRPARCWAMQRAPGRMSARLLRPAMGGTAPRRSPAQTGLRSVSLFSNAGSRPYLWRATTLTTVVRRYQEACTNSCSQCRNPSSTSTLKAPSRRKRFMNSIRQ